MAAPVALAITVPSAAYKVSVAVSERPASTRLTCDRADKVKLYRSLPFARSTWPDTLAGTVDSAPSGLAVAAVSPTASESATALYDRLYPVATDEPTVIV